MASLFWLALFAGVGTLLLQVIVGALGHDHGLGDHDDVPAEEGLDSGGPAFGRGVSGGVMFAGIVWGQTDTGFLLSALVNMRTDLGDLAVFF